MGAGIQERAKRCQKFWSRHLELTKQFQGDSLSSTYESSSVAVLGAGSLLDINTELLMNRFERISLWDANPTLSSVWQQFARALPEGTYLSDHCIDLTGSLDIWTEQLLVFLRSQKRGKLPALAALLSSLAVQHQWRSWQESEVIISANLLSQIPIYWRDRVHQIVQREWNLDSDDEGYFPAPVQAALEESMCKLQLQHLQQLSRSFARTVILVSDVRFMYYLQNEANWHVLPALYFSRPVSIDGFELTKSGSWFWHIAPQHIEYDSHGEIHDVHAWCFERSNPPTPRYLT